MKSIFVLTLIALLVAASAFPLALRIARRHHIVDNPNARKLQKEPVPVFGGIVVVLGMLIPLALAAGYYHLLDMWYIIGAILTLWVIGVTDDIRGLSAVLRFLLEVAIVWVFIWHPLNPDNGLIINDMLGLWNRHSISLFSAIPLTIVAGVGIINSINLIDGVDGYSSGYGIVANLLFGIIFSSVGYHSMALFAWVAAASLIPFYLHNVFGQKSKMFIGDGGSLVIGMVMTYNVLSLLDIQSPSASLMQSGVCLIALALAILCVPVFDTVRVMCARIIKGHSPFRPDKTHLHHLYISMGFSHVGTSTCIILTNLLVVGLWYVSYRLGASMNVQFDVVLAAGLLFIPGFYYGMRACQRRNNALWQFYCRMGRASQIERKGFWHFMQKLVDFGFKDYSN